MSTAATLPLSRRECQLVLLAARGLSTREVAGTLCLTEGTVNQYWTALHRRFGTHSRPALLALVVRRGWLTVGCDGEPALTGFDGSL